MKILFVCEYNACRSQMGEGLGLAFLPKDWQIRSAGLYPAEVNHLTIDVMREIGIDIASHRSKLLTEFKETLFDYAVILAEPAAEAAKILSVAKRLHWFYPDPLKTQGNLDQVKTEIRRVRDELKNRIESYFQKIL